MRNNTEENCAENQKSGHRRRDIGEDESNVRDLNRTPSRVPGPFIQRGIHNVYGTCFISVALQCLLAMNTIRERYVKPWDQLLIHISNCISYQIWNLFDQRCPWMDPLGAFELTGASPSPNELQQKIFKGQKGGQSALAILEIVKALDQENKLGKLQGGAEIIRPLMEDFSMSFQTKVTCFRCGSERSLPVMRVEMLEMNLPVTEILRWQPRGNWLKQKSIRGLDISDRSLRLPDLLFFMELQYMKNNHQNSMFCEQCKCPWVDEAASGSCEAKFEISIQKAPRVLLVSWMVQQVKTGNVPHLSNEIEFEEHLHLSKFASINVPGLRADSYKYRLIAVADYQPPFDPAEPGHTTVFVLGSKYGQDKWIHFDDAAVTPGIEEPQLLNATWWVSVYEKENLEIDLNELPNDVDMG